MTPKNDHFVGKVDYLTSSIFLSTIMRISGIINRHNRWIRVSSPYNQWTASRKESSQREWEVCTLKIVRKIQARFFLTEEITVTIPCACTKLRPCPLTGSYRGWISGKMIRPHTSVTLCGHDWTNTLTVREWVKEKYFPTFLFTRLQSMKFTA
jgi:hypothetical protein